MRVRKWSWMPVLATAVLLNPMSAQALEKGDWMARLGAAYLAPNDDSGQLTGVGGSRVGVDAASTVGFTIGGMVTDNLAIELFGIIPSKHELSGEGTLPGLNITEVGDVDVFPPTLSLNWYFMPKSNIRPHIGLGLSGTIYMDPEVSTEVRNVLGTSTELDVENTIGYGGNAGIDIDISDRTMLSLGVWYIDLDADATLRGAAGGDRKVDIEVNPVVAFVAYGARF